MDPKTVRRWRDRFLKLGLDGLREKPRSGRPPTIDAVSRCQVIAIACGVPEDFGVEDRTTWTFDAIFDVFRRRHPKAPMSRTSIHRVLQGADIRPHRMKMWLHSPDPDFRKKVTAICDLYLSPPSDAVVLCIDEKTGMQARGRRFPSRPPAPGRLARFEFEYIRHGTRTLIAAFDITSGRVYGEVRPSRNEQDLLEFMEAVARRYPRKKVYVIWDNLNIHHDGKSARWTRFNCRHGKRFRFLHTPLHASWVNQVELFFSIIARRILRYRVFKGLEDLERAVLAFLERWNCHEAHPFNWTFKGYPLQMGKPA
jgi:transposase